MKSKLNIIDGKKKRTGDNFQLTLIMKLPYILITEKFENFK